MSYPRKFAPLLGSIHTPWGIFPKGHVVKILGPKPDGVHVCLDSDELPAPVFEHTAIVPSHKLFTWPDDVEHGTPEGYNRHRTQYEGPCQRCREAHSAAVRAERLRTGRQDGLKVPRWFLAKLLDTADVAALEDADKLWGPETVDAIREAS